MTDSPAPTPASPTIRRLVYGTYMVLVTLFVASSIHQVGRTLFGEDASSSARGHLDAACERFVTETLRSIDEARARASSEATEEAARERYATERNDRRPSLAETSCKDDLRGRDALAALERLDRQAASSAARSAEDLRFVRRDVQSYISEPHP